MIPVSDENPTLRTPVMTYLLAAAIVGSWFYFQGAGSAIPLVRSVCELGLIPGELTGLLRVGTGVELAPGAICRIDHSAFTWLTPVTSMFLHGGWGHLIGNLIFFWVFANNVEDSMGRFRFLVFYLVCGLVAAAAQVFTSPASPMPMVGASGAISGVMGAYLVLYPRVRVNMFFPPFFFIPVQAWAVLLWWFGVQLLSGLPQLNGVEGEGVAFWAHVGGFLAGVLLVKPFENRRLVAERVRQQRRLSFRGF